MQIGYEVFHRDVGVLVDFYVDVLGFDAPEVRTAPDHVVVRRGEVLIGCTQHAGAETHPAPRRPPIGSEIVLRVADVHAEHDRVLAGGWPLADPLQTRPWGQTDFRVLDPSGQYLRISSAAASRDG